ncbi:hypothetical protein D3C80_1984080 [compost metagenome]
MNFENFPRYASRSLSSEPLTFCAVTCKPAASAWASARTLGSWGSCTRLLASCPAMVSGPRGRWYLNEREIRKRPLASKALAMLSPCKPW